MNWKQILIILLLIILAAILRLASVGSIPRGFHWDEAAYAYNAYSIKETGVDEWGVKWPIFLKSFGDYKPALLSYLIIPSFLILGENNLAARVVTAVLGIVSIIGVYGLIYLLTKSKNFATISAALVVISPIHIHYSRSVTDPIVAFSFLSLGFWAWLSNKIWIKSLGAILLILSMYTYNSSRYFVPLILVIHFLIFYKNKYQQIIKKQIIPLAIFGLGAVLILAAMLFGPAGARVKNVSIFSDAQIQDQVNENIYRSVSLGLGSMRILNNKLVTTGFEIGKNYLLHFQPDFWFFHNNLGARHAFSKHGNLLLISLPFFLLGLALISRTNQKQDYFFIIWLLLAPIAAALTQDVPHSGRILIILPSLLYFTTKGILYLANLTKRKKHVITLFIVIMFLLNTALYLKDYHLYFPEESEHEFQDHLKEVVLYINKEATNYRKVYFSKNDVDPYIFYAWYNLIKPNDFNKNKNKINNIEFLTIDHFIIGELIIEPDVLIVSSYDIKEKKDKIKKKFYFKNRFHDPSVSFVVYEN